MSKVYGFPSGYAPVRTERGRTAVCYDLRAEADGSHATWHELYFYHKRDGVPDIGAIRKAVTEDINARVTARIISGLTWNGKPVWLSRDNQMDWKAAYDRAVQTDGESLPVKFKLGEDADGSPVYHTFTTVSAFGDFHATWLQHIQRCLADGYAMKDGIDWSQYGDDGSGSGA